MRGRTLILAICLALLPALPSFGQSEACCLPEGGCIDLPTGIGLCEALQGVPQGDGTACASGICAIGACCFPTSCMEFASEEECDAAAGSWFGTGTNCAEPPCAFIGSCCLFDGSCLDDLTEEQCLEAEGDEWVGPGGDCSKVFCEPLGACCIAETGDCVDGTTFVQCEVDSQFGTGDWQGAGSSCNDASCPLFGFGACCLPDGECFEFIEESECTNQLGGLYQGDNLSCAPIACCNWDIDHSGFVDFPDLLSVLAWWGSCTSCPQDIDGDGEVAFPDLLAILANWGPCPQ